MGALQGKYVVGLDLGTTNYKAGIYDSTGTLLGLGSTAPEYDTAPDGRVELPVAQCHQLVATSLAEAADNAGVSLSDVAGIAYSSQANTFVLLDADYAALTPFIVWTDHRARQFPSEYQALANDDAFLSKVGFCNIAPGMMVANIDWIRTHQPETWAATRYIMTLPDYLVFQLTGERTGDSGSGALLGLWDIPANGWWPEALRAAGLSAEKLPTLALPGTLAGHTEAGPHRELFGLPAGIPVIVGSLDHHVAAIGAGAGKVAPFSISMGTVLAATCLDSRYEVHKDCCVGPGMHGEGYYRIAWHNNGTRALNWYRDTFAPDHTIDELLHQAETVNPESPLPSVELCPWERAADTVFSDGHASDNHGLYILAILTTMTNMLYDMLTTLQPDLISQGIVVTGGGARCDFWMQMIANRIQAPVYRSHSEQAGCMGAAVLAAAGAGWYPTIEDASAAMVKFNDCIQPAMISKSV
jgi:sugar (pentulose or hexulose) kinase